MAEQILLNINEYQTTTSEQLKDMGDFALGLKLLVKCCEASFVGICNHVLAASREIVLEEVYVVSTGRPLFGLVFLFYQDILSIHIIGINSKTRKRLWKENYGDDPKTMNSLMKQILPPSFSMESLDGLEHLDFFKARTDETLLPNFPHSLIKPTKWKILDAFDEGFKTVVDAIKNEKVLSLFGCGLNLGRRGTLAWLIVGVYEFVYLFDIAKLGAQEFIKSEIGEIICDCSILKVVHNGRKLEDYLYHQHGLNMANVFDTQASDIYLLRQTEKITPCLVRSLSLLLDKYLKMPKTEISCLFPEIEEESMWMERPLPEDLVIYLVHSVMFLKELRSAMMKLILFELEQINEAFVASLRNKPSALADSVEEQILPIEIREMIQQPSASDSVLINYVKKSSKLR